MVERSIRREGLVAVVVAGMIGVTSTAPLAAQRLADAPSHREAIQHFRAGQELMSAEKFERAAEEFSKAIASDPLMSLAYYQMGQAHMNMRRYASAIRAYKECLEAERQLYTLKQTNRFEVEKQREDEMRELKSILDNQKSGARVPTMLALEQRLRDLESQRSVVGGAFRPPAEALLALGSAYFRSGDRDAAEREWQAAIEANPKLGEAHNNIAVIYMQTDRLDQALEEVTLAEKAGFKVNPQFKADLKDKAKGR
jgi:tetratricopeptide (TPR) repeat protein